MKSSANRRDFLKKGVTAGGVAAFMGAMAASPAVAAAAATAKGLFADARDFGIKGDGKTDDTVAFRETMDKLPDGAVLFLPRGDYVVSGAIDMKIHQSIFGEPFGARFFVHHYDEPVLRVPGEARVADLAFIYPDNDDLANPKESPECISLVGNGAGYIDNLTFINAFIGVGTPEGGANCGQSVIRKLNGFVHDTMVRIDGSLDIVRIENIHCFVACAPNDDSTAYYRNHRKCLHILASDGTLISKSFMFAGSTFLKKELGKHGSGLSTFLSQCWCEGMCDYGIQVNDGSRLSVSGMEITCAFAKALIELNGGCYARLNSCYFRDSQNTTGVVVNEGSGAIITDCEFWGSPGFTAVELNSKGRSIISNNNIHHCEVGISRSPEADNYIISGNQLSANHALVGPEGKNTVVKDNI